jgi:hypothetical protein
VPRSPDFSLAQGEIKLALEVDPGPRAAGILSRDAAGKGDGDFAMIVAVDGRLAVRLQTAAGNSDDAVCSDASIEDGAWHQVEFHFGPGVVRLVIDGVEQHGAGKVDTTSTGSPRPGPATSTRPTSSSTAGCSPAARWSATPTPC